MLQIEFKLNKNFICPSFLKPSTSTVESHDFALKSPNFEIQVSYSVFNSFEKLFQIIFDWIDALKIQACKNDEKGKEKKTQNNKTTREQERTTETRKNRIQRGTTKKRNTVKRTKKTERNETN